MVARIAVVEDDKTDAETLCGYLNRYSQENRLAFDVMYFSNAVTLLENYKAAYDLIFMDIRMPYMDGMYAAHRLRELDPSVLLIFITTLAQYALEGYEVDAVDYIVKPVRYYDFSLKLTRVLRKLPAQDASEILLTTNMGTVRIDPDHIRYIESAGHKVIYHTLNGDFEQYNTLTELEKKLTGLGFSRCNSCYIVNLRYVLNIKAYNVTLDNCELRISQPRKKQFLQDFMDYSSKRGRL